MNPYRPSHPLMPGTRSAQAHLRAAAVFYGLLIVHLSLYPYAGWRELGVGAWEYWTTPWIPPQQRFLTGDAALNVLAYIPLGSLMLFSVPHNWRRHLWSGVLAWLFCTALSAGLEATQTFLPTRVPSKMDLLCNSVGAALGVLLARSVITLLQRIRTAITPEVPGLWDDANWEATFTLGLWLFCLLAPLPLPYVMGPWLGDIWLFFIEMSPADELHPDMEWLADWEMTAQALASILGMTGALCLGLAQTRADGQRLPLLLLLLLLALLTGWLAPQALPMLQGSVLLSPLQAWGETAVLSVTAAALIALCLALSDWPARRMALVSAVSLAGAVLCTAFLPGYSPLNINPQSVVAQRTLEYFIAAADWIGAFWPALATLIAWRLYRNTGASAHQPA